jgi:hypothetical protein
MLIDFYDDSTGAVLREVIEGTGVTGLPEYVKTAALIPSAEFRKDKGVLAWAGENKFACDTPADTWLSAAYFSKTAHLIPFQYHEGIAEAIKAAAEIHQIEADVAEFFPAEIKEAAEYALEPRDAVALANQQFTTLISETNDVEMLPKYASELLAACEAQNIQPVPALANHGMAVKRSHVIDAVRQRLGAIMATNEQSDRMASIKSAAERRGVDMPGYQELPRYDSAFLKAYDELAKIAREGELDGEFWQTFATLDKLAGFEGVPGFRPLVSMAGRPVQEDIFEDTLKLAGVQMTIQELMHKVAHDVYADLAPEVLMSWDNPRKVASVLTELPLPVQRMIMVAARGPGF